MTTQLFLTAAASPLGGSGQLAAQTVRGATSTNAVTDTTASGTDIQVTAATGGATPLSWWFQVGAASGFTANITANIRGKESNAANNAGAGILIEHYDSTGTSNLGTILSDRTVPATITEYTTTDAAKALASVAMTSTTFSNGDWIKITLKVRNVGTMGAATSGVTNTYSGPTSGAAGDTWVTFSNTLPLPVTPLRDATTASSTTTGFTSTLASLSFTHGVGAGPQNVATVAVIYGASTDNGTAAVTYGGVSMTAVGPVVHTDNATAGWAQLFKLTSGVPQGNQTVAISVTGTGLSASSLIGIAGTWTGAADISATNYTSGFGSGALGSIAGSSTAGDGTFVIMAAGNTLTAITGNVEATKNVNTSSGAGNAAMASGPGYANPVTYASSITASDIWAMIFADVTQGGSNATVSGSLATESSAGLAGSIQADGTIVGSLASEASTALTGSVEIDAPVAGSLATETSLALAGAVSAVQNSTVSGSLALGSTVALAGSIDADATISGSLALAASSGLTGAVLAGATLPGSLATEASLALTGLIRADADVSGSLAAETSQALTGSISVGGNAAVSGVLVTETSTALSGQIAAGATVAALIATAQSGALAGQITAGANISGLLSPSAASALVGVVRADGNTIGVLVTSLAQALTGSIITSGLIVPGTQSSTTNLIAIAAAIDSAASQSDANDELIATQDALTSLTATQIGSVA